MPLKNKLILLEKEDIEKKLNRLVCQILENYTDASQIQFVGLNKRGYELARLLKLKIAKLDKAIKISLIQGETESEIAIQDLKALNPSLPIIIVDDVLNTGRSLFQLVSLLAAIKPIKLEICVLAHRHHRKLPIFANYVGLTIATTVQEHIYFDMDTPELYLQ